ncbi:MAG: HD domain-containing phosphohydrolase [Candidatus Izemoplasmataceae bacterium]
MGTQTLERLLLQSEEILFELDARFKHKAIYGKWLSSYGLKESFFIGKDAIEIFGEKTGKLHIEKAKEAMLGKEVLYEWETTIEEDTYYLQTRLTPIIENEKVTGLMGIVRDVSKLKNLNHSLQYTNYLLNYIIEHLNSAVAVHDTDMNYIYVSKKYLDDYNVLEKDVIGKNHYEVFPDLPKAWKDVHQRALNGEVITSKQDRFIRESGEELFTRWEVRPWYKEDEHIGGIIVYTEVITEEVKLKQQLEKKTRDLFMEKQLAESTLSAIGDGVVSTDKNGLILQFNPMAETITGYKQEEVLNKPFNEIFILQHEETHLSVPSPIDYVLSFKKPVGLDSKTVLITKIGKALLVEDSAAPILDDEGEIFGAVMVFRDVTEKRLKQRRIEYLSIHDYLTGLYNRRYYAEMINNLDNELNYPLSIIMIDMNGLKIINDAYGHKSGDEALILTSNVLKDIFKTKNIARIGGDEFSVILTNTNHVMMQKLISKLTKKIASIKVEAVTLSFALGYALKESSDQDVGEVLKIAEDEMYQRKITYGIKARNQAINDILTSLTETYAFEAVHAKRVKDICKIIGKALGLSKTALNDLEMSAYYHDIGKVSIDRNLLSKKGPLTKEEYKKIQKHTENGYQILRAADHYSDLARHARYHHERYDGLGYPLGLRGDAIPFYARIITLADAFEAMTSDRPYRKKMTFDHAKEEIISQEGKQFDPKIVKAFLTVYEKIVELK